MKDKTAKPSRNQPRKGAVDHLSIHIVDKGLQSSQDINPRLTPTTPNPQLRQLRTPDK